MAVSPQNIRTPNLEDLVLAFRRKIMDTCRKEDVPYDLTFSQVEIIRYISPSGAKTLKDIAQHLKITPPSASAFIAELEKKKVITRVRDPNDRRSVSISLTPKARDIYQSMQVRKARILDEMLSRLSATDRKHLERIITILISE